MKIVYYVGDVIISLRYTESTMILSPFKFILPFNYFFRVLINFKKEFCLAFEKECLKCMNL